MIATVYKIKRLCSELRRRKLIQTIITYAILLAAVVGPVCDILGGIGAPEWMLKSTIYLLIASLPFVLLFSWVFDLTPHGIEVTSPLPRSQDSNPVQNNKAGSSPTRRLAFAIPNAAELDDIADLSSEECTVYIIHCNDQLLKELVSFYGKFEYEEAEIEASGSGCKKTAIIL